MNYYSFVTLAKAAGANIRIKKNVVIDLGIIEEYLEKQDNMAKQFAAGGKKKRVRYDEGALLYSMGAIPSWNWLKKPRQSITLKGLFW